MDSKGKSLVSLNLINKNALDIFNCYGYPNKNNEDWKYTNLKKFQSFNFSKPENFIQSKRKYNFDDLGITTINIVNNKIMFDNKPNILTLKTLFDDKSNKIYKNFIDISSKIAKSNPFFILNSANFTDGVFIKLDSKMKNVLINLVGYNKTDTPEAYFNRIHIEVSKNCDSNLFINSYGEKESSLYYKNTAITIDLNENSQINMTNIFEESVKSYSFNSLIVNQKKHSFYNGKSFFLKSNFIRNDIVNNLFSEGSNSNLDGLFVGKKNEFIDNNIKINHNSKHTTSKVLYKGILDDKSKAVFNAQVNVPFKSKKIDSDQKNHNILLSNTAKINSNPKLKISCDDVKCSHGSTIGNLDKDAIFYLRSRGIDLNKSKKILLNSFMNDIINKIDQDIIKKHISESISKIF